MRVYFKVYSLLFLLGASQTFSMQDREMSNVDRSAGLFEQINLGLNLLEAHMPLLKFFTVSLMAAPRAGTAAMRSYLSDKIKKAHSNSFKKDLNDLENQMAYCNQMKEQIQACLNLLSGEYQKISDENMITPPDIAAQNLFEKKVDTTQSDTDMKRLFRREFEEQTALFHDSVQNLPAGRKTVEAMRQLHLQQAALSTRINELKARKNLIELGYCVGMMEDLQFRGFARASDYSKAAFRKI